MVFIAKKDYKKKLIVFSNLQKLAEEHGVQFGRSMADPMNAVIQEHFIKAANRCKARGKKILKPLDF